MNTAVHNVNTLHPASSAKNQAKFQLLSLLFLYIHTLSFILLSAFQFSIPTMEPQLFIYDINRKAEISQSAQMGDHGLLKEYIETLQGFLNSEAVWVMHSSYSPDGAHITVDSSCERQRKKVAMEEV